MRCSFLIFYFFPSRVSILSVGSKIITQTPASVTNQDPAELFVLLIFLTLIARNFYNEHSVHLFVVYSVYNEDENFR